ncbi:MAG: PHP domain-containing protein [Candidatus Schekmanbacteria bacterium]|nr:PHP domain-containing protein [Candidatus Schekmanbacteria bacterium]
MSLQDTKKHENVVGAGSPRPFGNVSTNCIKGEETSPLRKSTFRPKENRGVLSMFLDLHVHTNRYSACSVLLPLEMVETAKMLKLDGLVITEHGILWDKEEIEDLKTRAKAGNLVVLRGQEIRTRCDDRLEGDVLVFGVEQSLGDELSAQELLEKVHSQGGVAIAAHPYRAFLGLRDNIYKLDLDGIEVFNGNTAPEEMQLADNACKILQLPGTGGSDAHSSQSLGNYLTFFSAWIKSEADLVSAIKQKQCRPAHFEEMRK